MGSRARSLCSRATLTSAATVPSEARRKSVAGMWGGGEIRGEPQRPDMSLGRGGGGRGGGRWRPSLYSKRKEAEKEKEGEEDNLIHIQ